MKGTWSFVILRTCLHENICILNHKVTLALLKILHCYLCPEQHEAHANQMQISVETIEP